MPVRDVFDHERITSLPGGGRRDHDARGREVAPIFPLTDERTAGFITLHRLRNERLRLRGVKPQQRRLGGRHAIGRTRTVEGDATFRHAHRRLRLRDVRHVERARACLRERAVRGHRERAQVEPLSVRHPNRLRGRPRHVELGESVFLPLRHQIGVHGLAFRARELTRVEHDFVDAAAARADCRAIVGERVDRRAVAIEIDRGDRARGEVVRRIVPRPLDAVDPRLVGPGTRSGVETCIDAVQQAHAAVHHAMEFIGARTAGHEHARLAARPVRPHDEDLAYARDGGAELQRGAGAVERHARGVRIVVAKVAVGAEVDVGRAVRIRAQKRRRRHRGGKRRGDDRAAARIAPRAHMAAPVLIRLLVGGERLRARSVEPQRGIGDRRRGRDLLVTERDRAAIRAKARAQPVERVDLLDLKVARAGLLQPASVENAPDLRRARAIHLYER